jgi:uncharacterized repeat protein (TIGR04138 family)
MDENPYRAPPTVTVVDRYRAPWSLTERECDPPESIFARAAVNSGRSIYAIRFAFDAIGDRLDFVEGSSGGHIRGPQFCAVIVGFAERIFGRESLAALAEFGLETGEDLGQCVAVMLEAGLMQASPDDAPEDFDGIGPLRSLAVPEDKARRRARERRKGGWAIALGSIAGLCGWLADTSNSTLIGAMVVAAGAALGTGGAITVMTNKERSEQRTV